MMVYMKLLKEERIMNKKITTKELTINAMLIAIIIVMASVPQLGMITIAPGVTVTIMHIPVIVAGLVLGLKSSLINAFAFGLSSLLVVLTRGGGPFDMLFLNPLVSVLPRLIFGVAVAGIAFLLGKIVKDPKGYPIVAIGTATLSTVIHTIAVVTAAFFAIGANNENFVGWPTTLTTFIGAFLTVNMLFEILVAVVIGVPLALALKKVHKR